MEETQMKKSELAGRDKKANKYFCCSVTALDFVHGSH